MSAPTDPDVKVVAKPVVATFSVKTSDGAFDSSLSIIIGLDPRTYEPVIGAWLALMHASLTAKAEEPKP